MFESVRKYIAKNYLPEPVMESIRFQESATAAMPSPAPSCMADETGLSDDFLSASDTFVPQSFSHKLFELIDARQRSDVEVYTRAGIDRRLFSKIRMDGYTPGKATVFRLVLALELNIGEAKELLEYAGFAFSRSSKTDLVVKYCVEAGIHDLMLVNEILDANRLPILAF